MASSESTQLELKAARVAANNFQSRLQTATNREEAFKLAIAVAENLLKATRLTSDAEEKKQISAQCRTIMDVASRIKSSEQWPAPTYILTNEPQRKPSNKSDANAAQLVDTSSVAKRDAVSLGAESFASAPTSRSPLKTRTPSMTANVSFDPHTSGANEAEAFNSNDPSSSNFLTRRSEVDLLTGAQSKDQGPNDGKRMADSTASPMDSVGKQFTDHVNLTPLSITSKPQVHRLFEPVSTRKRNKKEEIILYRASVVNGFKCPPWDKIPPSSEFTSVDGSPLFCDTHDLSLSPYQRNFFSGWLRASEALPPPNMALNGSEVIEPIMATSGSLDLVQDAATDCSVVASLCAGVARAERGHHEILANKLYPFDKQLGKPVLSSNGKYVVRLNFNGCWRKVVIDDKLPVSNTHRLLHVIDRHHPALLWPALLEKAYLKVRGGYDFPGSNSCSDLWTMTGWIPEQIFLQETDTVPDELWSRIFRTFVIGDILVTVGTGKMSARQEREFGLEGQHCYVVLDMKETERDRLLLIKNPWVEGRGWRGSHPDVAPILDSSNEGNSDKSTIEKSHSTTFWIPLEQVIRHFESLYLNWNPGLFTHRQDIHFEWVIEPGNKAGGCIVNHPQFSFWTKKTGTVWLLLNRHFRDTPEDIKDESDAFNDGSIHPDPEMNPTGEPSKGFMSIYVCNGFGQRLYIKDTYLESSDYVTTPQCLLKLETEAKFNYTIVIDQDDLPPSSYSFSLSALSHCPMTLEHAPQKYPVQKFEEGAWTKQSAGGRTSTLQYFDNPQYSLEVKHKSPIAVLLTTNKHEHPLHVKLAFGHGKRITRLQSRDVLADSGDHRSGCAFAETEDVQPGHYAIICSLFEPGQVGEFTLRVDSTNDFVLKQIPRDGAGLLPKRLAPACFGSTIHKVAAPILPHRLATHTIIARFLKAQSPRSNNLGSLARSPLRFSIERGRGPTREIICSSELGEYSDSTTTRCEAVTLEPQPPTHNDLWLVLDRLSGPGGPVEEWYEVMMYSDMPQACSIGVWRDWDD